MSKQAAVSKDVLIYGKHPAQEALRNPRRQIKEVWLTRENSALQRQLSAPARIVDKAALEALVGREAVHQGIVVRAAPLVPPTLDEFLKSPDSEGAVVVLDQVSDPHNVGAIMRSAAAFGARAVIIPDAGAAAETGALAKAASGALELVPFIRVSNLARALEALKKAGFWCFGLTGKAAATLDAQELPVRCAFILGSEGEGMRRLTEEACDVLARLPIAPAIESLNVSNAAAVSLYEYRRRHAASFFL